MEYKIRVCNAVLKRDVRTLSDMSPFVQLSINGNKKMTCVKEGGGKKPRWNQNLEIFVGKQTQLVLTVFDEDVIEANAIGRAWIDLTRFSELNKREDYTCEIYYDKKVVGKVQLQITKIKDPNSASKISQFQFAQAEQNKEEGANLFMNALFQNIVKVNANQQPTNSGFSPINESGGVNQQEYTPKSLFNSPIPNNHIPQQNQYIPPQNNFVPEHQAYYPPQQTSPYVPPPQMPMPQQNYRMPQQPMVHPQNAYNSPQRPPIHRQQSLNSPQTIPYANMNNVIQVPLKKKRIDKPAEGGCLSCFGL